MASRSHSAPGPSLALIVMVGLVIMLNYIDRGAVSIAAPLIKDEMGLSATGYGLVVSAFFWTYVPILVLAGWLADRMSVWWLMTGGVAIWALATLLMGFAGGLATLVVLRLLMGVGEGVAFPCASKLMARAPEARRGVANISLSAGLAIGPLVGTLMGGLILEHYGWRPMFVVFGVMTLAWLVPWLWRRREVDAPLADDAAGAVGYGRLLRTPALWALSLYHFSGTYVLYFVIAWLPLYLVKARGYDIGDMALLTAFFYLGQAAGAAFSGGIGDRLIAAGRTPCQVRRGIGLLASGVSAVGILAIAQTETTLALMVWLVPTSIAIGTITGILFVVGQTLAGPESAGRWVGTQTGFGNLSGVVGPVITGAIVDAAGYGPAFVVTAVIVVLGAIVFAVGVPRVVAVDWGRAT
ncbi:MFS transporter [Polymorphobacter fuscus]|uniref:MFS transporter n=1 Tax=Sandarakinorhabdus fusca TaxID=1439888 RepID=A0A7C9KYK3_9SPHN|nr:MFS transporter [Polymorphobacter fuscus]KAB7644098.1 MFS transporter [Polymorphobacter fuscus]MQT18482.1 MFS transporter [Polymorphobacter fuscus]NJC08397.1 ACS family D-galactonate transporter-like MFS transporter [Polymorphobacter fuscus]